MGKWIPGGRDPDDKYGAHRHAGGGTGHTYGHAKRLETAGTEVASMLGPNTLEADKNKAASPMFSHVAGVYDH